MASQANIKHLKKSYYLSLWNYPKKIAEKEIIPFYEAIIILIKKVKNTSKKKKNYTDEYAAHLLINKDTKILSKANLTIH